MKNIIFLAPIAAGKGTQSQMLEEKYGYTSLSTGEMFRKIIATGSKLGEEIKNIIASGNLVGDDLTIRLVEEGLEELQGKPFILDGFPRNLTQAQILNNLFANKNIDYHVIYLDLSEEEAMRRALGRLNCICGRSYNKYIEHLKPKKDSICDDCGRTLTVRDEDNEESFKIRYNNLLNNIKPVVLLYQELGKISIIDASRSVDEVFEDVSRVVIND